MIFLGDTHGSIKLIKPILEHAFDRGQKTIIQLGDWGFWWPNDFKHSELSKMLTDYGLHMYFIDGNHDLHPMLRMLPNTRENVAPGITYLKRGTTHTIDGITFGALGGAPSIDYWNRAEGLSIWEDMECISDTDISKLNSTVDILLLHDSPTDIPGIKEISDVRFNTAVKKNRERITRAVEITNPKIIYHGHMHTKLFRDWNGIEVRGLDCTGRSFTNPFEDCTHIVEM